MAAEHEERLAKLQADLADRLLHNQQQLEAEHAILMEAQAKVHTYALSFPACMHNKLITCRLGRRRKPRFTCVSPPCSAQQARWLQPKYSLIYYLVISCNLHQGSVGASVCAKTPVFDVCPPCWDSCQEQLDVQSTGRGVAWCIKVALTLRSLQLAWKLVDGRRTKQSLHTAWHSEPEHSFHASDSYMLDNCCHQ